jgi:chromosome segregation ATPase
MTSSRYLVARLAQAFGYFRRNQRMADAASEMHLLREAEAFLGAAVWEKVEPIEALSVEYWNLRKLIKERDVARARLAECSEKLNQAHEERVALLNSTPETDQELLDERITLLNELEALSKNRDQIVADAREVRRTYVGLKMKLEVLTKESNGYESHKVEIDKVKARLLELKTRFADLKQERIKIGESIEAGDAKIDVIDDKLREKRQKRRGQASETFQLIGEGNKEISALRAETSLIDTKMRQLYAEIGRYVSRNANQDPDCAAVAQKHHGLVDVMRALRRSIALNHRLAGTA